MILKLEVDTNEPQDTTKALIYLKAEDIFGALIEIKAHMSGKRKRGHDWKNADQALEGLWNAYHEILGYCNINLDDLGG